MVLVTDEAKMLTTKNLNMKAWSRVEFCTRGQDVCKQKIPMLLLGVEVP